MSKSVLCNNMRTPKRPKAMLFKVQTNDNCWYKHFVTSLSQDSKSIQKCKQQSDIALRTSAHSETLFFLIKNENKEQWSMTDWPF